MNVYERIFSRLEELHMSQTELSKRTGIPTSTISDWRKKKINPQSDKLVSICKVLNISLVDLLCGEEDMNNKAVSTDCIINESRLIEYLKNASSDVRRRVFAYCFSDCYKENNTSQDRNISIIQDEKGKSIVLINDIRYRSRRSIDWDEIETYLKQYVGECFEILETSDKVYVGTDFPDEFAHSNDTKNVKGLNEKAKANASVAIDNLIEIATDKTSFPDYDKKHGDKAKYGWYRYTTRFGIPVYDEDGVLLKYNIFKSRILVRRAADGKLYLYDLVTTKKETSRPLES